MEHVAITNRGALILPVAPAPVQKCQRMPTDRMTTTALLTQACRST